MKNDSREDYLINILRLTEGSGTTRTSDLAEYMGVAQSSVTEMLKILSREGYVDYERYHGVALTKTGLSVARDLRRKHHIMERFLQNVLDMSEEDAHAQAHAMEHSISDGAAWKLCRITGTNYDEDCESCEEPCTNSAHPISVSVPVSEMKNGERGRISHLSSKDGTVTRKLISMGFVPGRDVEMSTVVSDKGARIIKLGESVIALDLNMASAIFVDRK